MLMVTISDRFHEVPDEDCEDVDEARVVLTRLSEQGYAVYMIIDREAPIELYGSTEN